MQEWYEADSQARLDITYEQTGAETILLVEGNETTIYRPGDNMASVIDDGQSLEFPQKPLRADLLHRLVEIENSHELTLEGETKIIDRTAYHIKAEKEGRGSYDMWIDKDNGFVLKMMMTSDEAKTEINYTSVAFDVDIPEEKWAIDLTDVYIIDWDEELEK